jgi:hypothetical protein
VPLRGGRLLRQDECRGAHYGTRADPEIPREQAWLPQTVPVLLGGDGLRYHVSPRPDDLELN